MVGSFKMAFGIAESPQNVELGFSWPDPTAAEDQVRKQLQTLQIIIGEYPQISFTNKDGAAVGLAVEVVKEIIMKKISSGGQKKADGISWKYSRRRPLDKPQNQ